LSTSTSPFPTLVTMICNGNPCKAPLEVLIIIVSVKERARFGPQTAVRSKNYAASH
jgi:hypothetical protein